MARGTQTGTIMKHRLCVHSLAMTFLTQVNQQTNLASYIMIYVIMISLSLSLSLSLPPFLPLPLPLPPSLLGAVAVAGGGFGPGSGPVFLDSMQCAGDEKNLLQCKSAGIALHSCSHFEDAGVICAGIKVLWMEYILSNYGSINYY